MVKTPKVSIVIPVYKPDKDVFKKLKDALKKQTIKTEVIENWNMPEAKSMNTGIKKAKGEIVVTLAQDCVPTNNYWLEKLIKPLENKEIIATVSDLHLPKKYWKKYPFLTRILTLNERNIQHPGMDARACAYRKKDLIKAGMFNEDPNTIAIEKNLCVNLKKMGKIFYPNCAVYHLHPLNNKRKIQLIKNYAEGNGKTIKIYGINDGDFCLKLLRAIPFLGFAPMFYRFPFKKHLTLLPIYIFFSPIQHVLWVLYFWKGFFFSGKESQRNLEVLKENNNK